jgi:hypothetical protein
MEEAMQMFMGWTQRKVKTDYPQRGHPYTRLMLILGFESSCDETGVALVDASGAGVPRLLAHALHSQIEMHQAYGGVVP